MHKRVQSTGRTENVDRARLTGASFVALALMKMTLALFLDQNSQDRDGITSKSGRTLQEIHFLTKSFMLLAEFSSIKEKSA